MNWEYAYDLSGHPAARIMEFPIAAATAIELGEIVKMTPGTGIEACSGTDFDDPVVGVAAEAHDGSTAGRQSGTKIKVYCSPTAVFKRKPRGAITATGGSTTTFVDSNLKDLDDLYNGGKLHIVACAADATLNGKIVDISDYTGTSGTITIGETLAAALASGDTAYLLPGKLAIGEYSFDLDSDGTDIDWETAGGEALQIVDSNPDTFELFVMLRLHQFGNDAAAK
jgi:hypothetical protein